MERWIADRPDNPGEAVRQWLKDLYQDNKLVRNELVLGGRRVDLRNITMPVLNIYAQGDVIIPNACSRGQNVRFGTSDYTELGRSRRAHRHFRRRQGAEDPCAAHRRMAEGADVGDALLSP